LVLTAAYLIKDLGRIRADKPGIIADHGALGVNGKRIGAPLNTICSTPLAGFSQGILRLTVHNSHFKKVFCFAPFTAFFIQQRLNLSIQQFKPQL
jgi:hypothetical protein